MNKPQHGAHLAVHYGTFYHHGIYCGNNTVIHLSRAAGRVTTTTLEGFADGRKVYVVETSPAFSSADIVQRATSRLHQPGYCLFTNNCEHFARWCREGRAYSVQVLGGLRLLTRRFGKGALARSGGKAAGRVLGKQLGGAAAKTVAKGGGAFLAVDAAQIAVEQMGGMVGLDQDTAQAVGKAVGVGGHAAVGAVLGGPAGAAVGVAIWGVGEVLGSLF